MTEIIVAVIGGVVALGGSLITIIASNKRLEKKVDEIQKHEEENYLGLLRLTVMSEEMPVAERIIAGSKYIKAGGNGEVKDFFYDFVEEHTK